MLIGKLLLYTKTNNNSLLVFVQGESAKMCEKLMNENANYESALCNIVNGICNILQENYEKGLDRFFTALNCSNLGEFNTLRWKIYMNIAETFSLLYLQKKNLAFQEQAIHYAKCGKQILDKAVEINKNLETYQELTEIPQCYFNSIINNTDFPTHEPKKPMIQVKYKQFYFYIMD